MDTGALASQKSGGALACALGSIFLGRLFFWFVFFCQPARSRSGKGRAKQKKMNESTDERIRRDEIVRELKAMISEGLAYRRSKKSGFCSLILKKLLSISLLPDNSDSDL
jgi:hypothetical protein